MAQWRSGAGKGGGGVQSGFSDSSKSDEKMLGGEGEFVSGLCCVTCASTEFCSEIRFYELK